MTKIAINGFGRIGRAAGKIALERSADIELVAINDLGDIKNLAYLLQYDSVYGRYSQSVRATDEALVIGDVIIPVFHEKEPAKLPWQQLGVDVVIESTGVFTDREGAAQHLAAGSKRVIISAPTDSEDVPTLVQGVNDDILKSAPDIVSNASCTTNCIAPVAAVMDRAFGVAKALLTTAHAYTATQSLVDGPAKGDWRRGRAGAINLVPASTGAAVAAAKAFTPLQDKFDGIAIRVPVPVVSLSDFTFLLKRTVNVDEVNEAMRAAATDAQYQGVLAVTDEPLVSTDLIGDPHSAICDLTMTRVVGGDLVKVLAWYDNEWGYSNRLVEQAVALGGK